MTKPIFETIRVVRSLSHAEAPNIRRLETRRKLIQYIYNVLRQRGRGDGARVRKLYGREDLDDLD